METHNRSSFENSPEHILSLIIENAEKRYPILLTCKATAILAGPILYRRMFTLTSVKSPNAVEADNSYVWHQVFAGLDDMGQPSTTPLGRDLKLRCIRSITVIEFVCNWDNGTMLELAGSIEGINPMINRIGEELDAFTDLLVACREAGIILLPNLYCGIIWFNPFMAPPSVGQRLIRTIALSCKPQYFSTTLVDNLADVEAKRISHQRLLFDERHLPQGVIHRTMLGSYDFENKIPSACYGTENVVECTERDSAFDDVDGLVRWITRVLKQIHPEIIDDDRRNTFSEAELQRRDATSWRFVWKIPDPIGPMRGVNGWYMMRAENQVLQAFPAMKDRVSISCDFE
ncbi:hypothetical protein CI109_100298 [Kwoniella shandongensis]|uniref:Uncharacterized protein n=1 Tax=Kwoniella shandongensis TaxID=1734106 RepID=A0A5M6C429_9TREE|nr:uncharacterized protein CI109_001857 [Kwoniella shandongensis]KAA5529917.1 hypothetical protein CI109_001857 [Kwoniella shandongensis]